ncbi:DUF2807 domain-containing protein [bacterium]|nr:MAG: DUF2807 domain-containing protein [bacterium]
MVPAPTSISYGCRMAQPCAAQYSFRRKIISCSVMVVAERIPGRRTRHVPRGTLRCPMRPLAPLSFLVLAGCGMPGIAMLTGAAGSQTQGKGPVVTSNRTAKVVNRIVVTGGLELEVRVGSPSVKISAQRNIEPMIKTRYENGTLTIAAEGDYSTSQPTRAVVHMPSLSHLSVGGGSTAVAQGFKTQVLDLSATGAGEILWKGDAARLNAISTGGGTVRLKGTAKSATMEANGAAAVDIDRLDGGDLTLRLSGASHATIPGRAGKLKVIASGASDANLGTLTSHYAEVQADGASTVKIGRTGKGWAKANGASRVEYRGKLDRVEAESAAEIVSK